LIFELVPKCGVVRLGFGINSWENHRSNPGLSLNSKKNGKAKPVSQKIEVFENEYV
jgi:hypothetical protein